MNKTDLAKIVAGDHDLTQTRATLVVDTVLNAIQHAVAAGDDVRLPGHGTYKATRRPARTARNPMTGDTIDVPAKTVPAFTPAGAFKDQVNRA